MPPDAVLKAAERDDPVSRLILIVFLALLLVDRVIWLAKKYLGKEPTTLAEIQKETALVLKGIRDEIKEEHKHTREEIKENRGVIVPLYDKIGDVKQDTAVVRSKIGGLSR